MKKYITSFFLASLVFVSGASLPLMASASVDCHSLQQTGRIPAICAKLDLATQIDQLVAGSGISDTDKADFSNQIASIRIQVLALLTDELASLNNTVQNNASNNTTGAPALTVTISSGPFTKGDNILITSTASHVFPSDVGGAYMQLQLTSPGLVTVSQDNVQSIIKDSATGGTDQVQGGNFSLSFATDGLAAPSEYFAKVGLCHRPAGATSDWRCTPGNEFIKGNSGPFTLVAPSANTQSVSNVTVSPTQLHVGDQLTVRWQSQNIPTTDSVLIQYAMVGCSACGALAPGQPIPALEWRSLGLLSQTKNTGSYVFTIPNQFGDMGDVFQIRVGPNLANGVGSATSNTFSVSPSTLSNVAYDVNGDGVFSPADVQYLTNIKLDLAGYICHIASCDFNNDGRAAGATDIQFLNNLLVGIYNYDIDGDGRPATSQDLQYLDNAINGVAGFTCSLAKCDLNADGKVDAADEQALVNKKLTMPSSVAPTLIISNSTLSWTKPAGETRTLDRWQVQRFTEAGKVNATPTNNLQNCPGNILYSVYNDPDSWIADSCNLQLGPNIDSLVIKPSSQTQRLYYRIRVVYSVNGDLVNSDWSPMTTVAAGKTDAPVTYPITYEAPFGGGNMPPYPTVARGSSQTITIARSGMAVSGDVTLKLYDRLLDGGIGNEAVNSGLPTIPSGTNSASWTVPSTLSAGTYILRTLIGGNRVTESGWFIITSAPALTFDATLLNLSQAQQVQLTWNAQNVTSCRAGGDGGSSWTGGQNIGSYSLQLGGLSAGAKTFTLTCTDDKGGSVTKSAMVTIPDTAFVARDQRRKDDLTAIQAALERYADAHPSTGYYVANSGWNQGGQGWFAGNDGLSYVTSIASVLQTDTASHLSSAIADDPDPTKQPSYMLYLCSTDLRSYALYASLEYGTQAERDAGLASVRAAAECSGAYVANTFGKNYVVRGQRAAPQPKAPAPVSIPATATAPGISYVSGRLTWTPPTGFAGKSLGRYQVQRYSSTASPSDLSNCGTISPNDGSGFYTGSADPSAWTADACNLQTAPTLTSLTLSAHGKLFYRIRAIYGDPWTGLTNSDWSAPWLVVPATSLTSAGTSVQSSQLASIVGILETLKLLVR